MHSVPHPLAIRDFLKILDDYSTGWPTLRVSLEYGHHHSRMLHQETPHRLC
jgi:hypothetical protein